MALDRQGARPLWNPPGWFRGPPLGPGTVWLSLYDPFRSDISPNRYLNQNGNGHERGQNSSDSGNIEDRLGPWTSNPCSKPSKTLIWHYFWTISDLLFLQKGEISIRNGSYGKSCRFVFIVRFCQKHVTTQWRSSELTVQTFHVAPNATLNLSLRGKSLLSHQQLIK